MKKIIIHMINGDEYHIWEGESFDNNQSFNLDEFSENFVKMPTRFVKISRSDGYGIKYVSRFSINMLEGVTIRIEGISSIDLLEVD